MRFKYGDRVRCSKECYTLSKGETGTVYGYGNENSAVGVCWDSFVLDRHRLNDCWPECPGCDAGHGWFVSENALELISRVDALIGLEEFI